MDARVSREYRQAITIALLLPLGFMVVDLAWRSRHWPLVHDAPIMHYVAWRIGEGAVPYRDLFDMNFPGTYLIHLAVVRVLGPGDEAWRVFDLTWLAAGAFAVAALAAPWSWTAAVGGAMFFAAYHLAGGAWHAGQRDFLLCPLLLLGALGVARWMDVRAEAREGAGGAPAARRAARWPEFCLAWGGLALGAGMTIKPHVLLFAAALGVFVVGVCWRTRRASPIATFAGAVAIAPVAIVVWVAVAGALPAWRAIVLDYLVPLYSRLAHPAPWGFHRWQVWIPLGVALTLSIGGAAWGRRLTARHAIALTGLVYGVVHYLVQGKGWEYHLYPAAAFTAVLLFSELDSLMRVRRPVAGVVLAVSLVAAYVMLGPKGAEAAAAADRGWIRAKERRVSALAADLRARLAPGDLVQVLDTTEGGLHALLRLRVRQPTRFLYDFHFFHDAGTPAIQALRAEFLHDFDARPPRYVVIFRAGWPAGDDDRVAAFPELAARLARNFRLDTRGDGYVIHAKRDDP